LEYELNKQYPYGRKLVKLSRGHEGCHFKYETRHGANEKLATDSIRFEEFSGNETLGHAMKNFGTGF
jgi:hypothetical protein